MTRKLRNMLVLCIAVVMLLSSCNTGVTPIETNADTDAVTEAVEGTAQDTTADTLGEASDTEASTEATTTDPTDTHEADTQVVETEPETEVETEVETEAETEAVTEDPKAKYELGYKSNMDMSAYDPIENHEKVTAPQDDATLKMWFDHLTEKVARYDTSDKDSDADSYTIQMAKNEMEGCHFYLYSPTERKVTIKVSDFENANGEKLATELGVEFYIEEGYIPLKGYTIGQTNVHDRKVDVYPDAVIPYESYIKDGFGGDEGGSYEYGTWVPLGPYSYKPWDTANYPYRDTVRGFVIQTTTTADTTPGAYQATVEIYDAVTGDCIKMANVYTYVYDVTLDEETALDTAMGIWGEHYINIYRNAGGYNEVEVIKSMAEFMLKYRMTPNFGQWTLENVLCPDGNTTWLKDPRVTTFKVYNKDMYDRYKDDPILAKKCSITVKTSREHPVKAFT